MLIDHLAASLSGAKPYVAIAEMLARGEDATLATPGLVRPALVASLFTEMPRPMLVVVAGEENAERFWRQTSAFLGRERVLHFPDRSDLPWTDAAPDLAQVGARARALHSLDKNRRVVVVASARALLRSVPPQGSQVFDPLCLEVGATLDLTHAAERLARMGYERVETAEEPGQFALRGGILDIFGADSQGPVRAELFGDEIESLKRYVPTTGQTIGDAEPSEIYPCRELQLSSRGAEAVEKAIGDKARTDSELQYHLEMIQQGLYFNGVERYLPLLYKRPGMPTEYLGADVLVVAAEPRSLFDDAVRRHEELEGITSRLIRTPLEGLYLSAAKLDFGERQRLTLLSLLRAGAGVDAELAARRPEVSGGEERFVGGVRSLLSAGYAVALAVPDRRARQRVGDTLAGAGVTVALERDRAISSVQIQCGIHSVKRAMICSVTGTTRMPTVAASSRSRSR